MGNSASSLMATTIMVDDEPNNPIFIALKRRAENAEQEDEYFVDMSRNIRMMQQSNAREEDALETRRRRRSCKKARSSLMILDENGNLVEMHPRNSTWWTNYVESPQLEDPRFLKTFRLRFRLPYPQYQELIVLTKSSDRYFKRWFDSARDATGERAAPLEILVLGALRYLGRGWTFDDLYESTGVLAEVHRQFFHVFIAYASDILFTKFVVMPTNMETAATHVHEMSQSGFHGAVGSTDATHIVMEKCHHNLKQYHMSPKVKHAARTYNLTVNHRRRILSTTSGHPARWNDKTIILFDDFVRGIHEGRILQDMEFTLYEHDESGNVVSVKYCGAWILVDNGYLNWATTVAPFKNTTNLKEYRWSEWLESMRKDVECTFGILKGRWRLLKTGIRVHGHKATDMIWKTCCALHNWLLEVDGLDDQWELGVQSPWEGELGMFHPEDLELIPEHIRNRLSPIDLESYYDLSHSGTIMTTTVDNVGVDDDEDEEAAVSAATTRRMIPTIEEPLPSATSGVPRLVRKLSNKQFRDCLVEHFDILFQKNEIKWPRRFAAQRPPRMPRAPTTRPPEEASSL